MAAPNTSKEEKTQLGKPAFVISVCWKRGMSWNRHAGGDDMLICYDYDLTYVGVS